MTQESDYQEIEISIVTDFMIDVHERLTETIEWFQTQLHRVPEEHREKTMCKIYGQAAYPGEHNAMVDIWYTRLETPMEHGQRLGREQNEREAEIAEARAVLSKYGK